jgi:hypothetical protein
MGPPTRRSDRIGSWPSMTAFLLFFPLFFPPFFPPLSPPFFVPFLPPPSVAGDFERDSGLLEAGGCAGEAADTALEGDPMLLTASKLIDFEEVPGLDPELSIGGSWADLTVSEDKAAS